jgi:hypothetical protein
MLQVSAQLAPGGEIGRSELRGRGRLHARGDGGDQAHRAADDQRGASDLAPRDPALMMASGTEEVLQIIVRPWEVGKLVTVEQARPVAPSHGAEVVDGRRQRAHGGPLVRHRGEQLAVGAA